MWISTTGTNTGGLATFHDPSLFTMKSANGVSHDNPGLEHTMAERPKFCISLLSTGLDVLLFDADIVFSDNPFTTIDRSVDLVMGSDSREC